MNEIITIEEFSRINFRIGEVVEVGKKTKIRCLDKDYLINLNIAVEKGDKIAVIIANDSLVIPIVKDAPLVVGKDAEVGDKIS